ncbi:hypothetical protein HHI36_013338 [Cryptolaemus montrouzieri]|uniref:Lipid storage droplets surface-binding protein 1 n=1 Tax=Cryptolaemus montrouzieri TaxID=559131 RepID=A0ABD2NH29_9CUCU
MRLIGINITNVIMASTYKDTSWLENLESYNRIVNIPIVHSGLNIAENIYVRIKKTNNILTWTLDQAEDTIKAVSHSPVIGLLGTPLNTVDRVICKSLDIAESRIPSINLPPQMIYFNTKNYVSDVSTKIVKRVLKRADSVKQIGNTVLTSKYTEYAADKLDDALDVADAYIDKYLPDKEDQKENNDIASGSSQRKAIHTIKHADRVSRKIQRRLTKRTLEHAKIIKEQSTEAIHVLLYVAELIATDPKLALQKGKELWHELSKDEPENQARPQNVEELFVLVVRESARQLVHLVNYSTENIAKLPRLISQTAQQTSKIIQENTETLIQSIHFDEIEKLINDAFKFQAEVISFILQEIESFTSKVWEQAHQSEAIQSSQPIISLAVPKIEFNSKAASAKSHSNSNHHHSSRDHHGHHGRRNGKSPTHEVHSPQRH